MALPLKTIFEAALNDGVFPDHWKKGNVIPVHKKDLKTMLINYRPISLLPIFAKIFEKIIFTSMFEYFIENELFTVCQTGFLPGNSCTLQPLSIIHEIQKSLDESPPIDVRSIFLDISKAFNKVWHKGPIYKLKSYQISGNLLKLIENYLTGRKQRVVLNGQNSSGERILSGVPQGSVLRPLLLIIYINDLPDVIQSICKIFVDDTSLFSKCHDFKQSERELNEDLTIIKKWAFQWKMDIKSDSKKQAIEVCFFRKIVSNIQVHFLSTNLKLKYLKVISTYDYGR